MVPELALSRTAERLRTSERMSDMAEYDRFSTVTVHMNIQELSVRLNSLI